MVDRNDRSGLPGYDELIARGNYHRLVGGPDFVDLQPDRPRREPVGTVFGFMEPLQTAEIQDEEPDLLPSAGIPLVPTVERNREMPIIADRPTVPTIGRTREMPSGRPTVPTVQRNQNMPAIERSKMPTVGLYKEMPSVEAAGRPTIPTKSRHQEMPTGAIPTEERHKVIPSSSYNPPLLQRKQPVKSRTETVEPDCAPSYRQHKYRPSSHHEYRPSSEVNGNRTIPSFGISDPDFRMDPKKAHLVEEFWNQGHGSVDSGLGSVSVSFPSRDDTHFVPSVNSITDSVRHISIKEEKEPVAMVTGKTIRSPLKETELLQYTPSVDNQDPNKNSLLHTTEKFQRNLKCFEQDSDLETNMHHLIYADQDEVVKYLLDDMMSYHLLDIANKKKQTILHVAAIMNKPKLCRSIMVHGASVDLRDLRGNTPLHIACQKGHMECVQVLSKHLNYQEVKDLGYQVPFRCIPQSSELRNYDGQTCLHLAVTSGHYDIVHYLVHDLHADINAQEGKRGLTPLMQCVERRDARMVMYLVQQCRASIHTRTYDRKNALELAEGRGYTDIANLLLAIGAEADYADEEEFDWIEEDVGEESMETESDVIGQ